jgi:hypothetical protein
LSYLDDFVPVKKEEEVDTYLKVKPKESWDRGSMVSTSKHQLEELNTSACIQLCYLWQMLLDSRYNKGIVCPHPFSFNVHQNNSLTDDILLFKS